MHRPIISPIYVSMRFYEDVHIYARVRVCVCASACACNNLAFIFAFRYREQPGEGRQRVSEDHWTLLCMLSATCSVL